MIECGICEEYFHADEIRKCPECGMELCDSCYQKHVKRCLNPDFVDEYDEDEDWEDDEWED